MSQNEGVYGSYEYLEKLLGQRLKHYRLEQNINQTNLAEKAGVSRRTITAIENGEGSTIDTLLRVLRALDKMDLLHTLFREPEVSPMQVHYSVNDKPRKNASKPRKGKELSTWTWGDEQTDT